MFARHVFKHGQEYKEFKTHTVYVLILCATYMWLHTYAYLVVLGVVVWEGVLVVVGLVGGLEEGLVEDLGVYPVEVQEAEDEALDPSCLQAYQEASRMEEHLNMK